MCCSTATLRALVHMVCWAEQLTELTELRGAVYCCVPEDTAHGLLQGDTREGCGASLSPPGMPVLSAQLSEVLTTLAFWVFRETSLCRYD